MAHTDDAYAAMLLTMALSPNREEYARPFNTQEFRRLEAAVRASELHSLGALLGMDISGLMIYLKLSEAEGYRAYTLMHRDVQLSYALEGYAAEGIEVVTQYDDDYPHRLEEKLRDAAPPFIYRCGSMEKLSRPAIAILGIQGVRTSPEARRLVESLVRGATGLGYSVITGGEPGVSFLAASVIYAAGGYLVDVLGGGLHGHLEGETIAQLVGQERATVLSTEHPDAMFTVSHAAARNRLLFALADAAFIFNTDGRRGEAEAIQNRICDWVYAWEGYPGNAPLFARGAVPFADLQSADLEQMSRHWSSSRSRQLNIFDML